MTTTNHITTTQQLSNLLVKEGIHHYTDEVTASNGTKVRTEIEIPIGRLLIQDYTKFFKALKISNDLALQGYGVIVSEDAKLITVTIKD